MKKSHLDENPSGLNFQEYLDVIVNFGSSLKSEDIVREGDIPKVYEATLSALDRLIGFKAGAVALFDDVLLNCDLSFYSPKDQKERLAMEMEHLIEKGVFAWVLQNNRWTCVPSGAGTGKVMISTLSTRTKTLGVFIAVVEAEDIADIHLKIVSIILSICANTIENISLYEEIKSHNRNLEKTVEQRTIELEKALTKANVANTAKTEFLANISHELLTPMNGIAGLAQLLGKSELNGFQKDSIKKINALTSHLKNMIRDILEFSQKGGAYRDARKKVFNPAGVMDELFQALFPRARKKGIGFTIESEGTIPGKLIGIPEHLRKTVFHLTDNALKFTDEGEVTISVVRLPHPSSGKVRLEFRVQDTGIGMSEEHLEALFTPFHQADGSAARKYEGIGLSLPLCRKLVEQMGGQIQVASEPGKGSRFSFTALFGVVAGSEDIRLIFPGGDDLGDTASLLDRLYGFDLSVGLENAGMDERQYFDFILRFCHEYGDAAEKVVDIINKGHLTRGKKYIVNFIGVCGTLGALNLCRIAKGIEKGFRHTDSENFKGLIQEFERECQIVFNAIKAVKPADDVAVEKRGKTAGQDVARIKNILTRIEAAVAENTIIDETLVPALIEHTKAPMLRQKVKELESAVSRFDYPAAATVIRDIFNDLEE